LVICTNKKKQFFKKSRKKKLAEELTRVFPCTGEARNTPTLLHEEFMDSMYSETARTRFSMMSSILGARNSKILCWTLIATNKKVAESFLNSTKIGRQKFTGN
jgi:hypothetical protein